MWAAVAQEILLLFLPLLPTMAKKHKFAGDGALCVSVAVKMRQPLVLCSIWGLWLGGISVLMELICDNW